MRTFFKKAVLSGSVVLGLFSAGCLDQHPTTPATQVTQATAGKVEVVKWAPHSTPAGKGFNVQANGDSAIWFQAPGIQASGPYELEFGDTKINKVVIDKGKGGSVEIPKQLLDKEGKFPVVLVEKTTGTRYELGTFEIVSAL